MLFIQLALGKYCPRNEFFRNGVYVYNNTCNRHSHIIMYVYIRKINIHTYLCILYK